MPLELHNDLVFKEPNAVVSEVADMMSRYNKWRGKAAVRRQAALRAHQGVATVAKSARVLPSLQIDPYVYHYFGQSLGYECWDDDDFIDWVETEIPVRVKTQTESLTVHNSWGANRLETRREPRFHKSYG